MAASKFMARKWVKPLILFLALTLISILAYENSTSGVGSGVVFVGGTNKQTSNVARVDETQMPKHTTVSNSEASFSVSARINSTTVPVAAGNQTTHIGSKSYHSTTAGSLETSREEANPYEDIESDVSSYNFEEEEVEEDWRTNTPSSLKTNSLRTNHSVSSLQPFLNISKVTKVLTSSIRSFNQQDLNLLKERTNVKEIGKKIQRKPVFIVLLGRMRTGSSLIGEIFNQNPEVGFLYEPLHALCDWYKRGTVSRSKIDPTSTNLLDKLSVCEFTPNFISSIIHWPTGGGPRSSMLHPVCAKTNSCKHATSKMLRHNCLKYQRYRGIKTIRADLNMLRPLIEKGAVDIKILHLIRDPRGTANSRRKVYSSESSSLQRRLASHGIRNRILIEGNKRIVLSGPLSNPYRDAANKFSPAVRNQHYLPARGTRLDVIGLLNKADVFPTLNTIPNYCQWLRSTIEVTQRKPEWLRGRYKLVRYEDYAADPLLVTRDIYHYFDMVLPDGVRRWVTNNTSEDIKGDNRLYGSHRNSSETAFKWRRQMLAQEAQQVERECGDVMERLGYLRTSQGLRLGDLRHELIRPLPRDIPREL